MNPPEAADAARFAPPPGSQFGEDLKETMRQKFSGPGWDAADVAAGGLGALIGMCRTGAVTARPRSSRRRCRRPTRPLAG